MTGNDLEATRLEDFARKAYRTETNEIDAIGLRWFERLAVTTAKERTKPADLMTLIHQSLSQADGLARPLRPHHHIAGTHDRCQVNGVRGNFNRHLLLISLFTGGESPVGSRTKTSIMSVQSKLRTPHAQ